MTRFLITGGSGFIGSNFIRHILKNQREILVTNLDKLTYAGNRENTKEFESDARYEFVHGDICDAKQVGQLVPKVDVVVHFAAESHVDRSIDSAHDFVQTNVLGTNTLLEVAKRSKIKRFIHFSTDEVYGSRREGSFAEVDALNPSSPYSASKAGSDLLALAYWKTHKVPVTVIRSSNNFGPYQFPEKAIPLFITNLIDGKKIPLYGKGENVRDWIFVEDCTRATETILERGLPGEIYNVAGYSEMNNLELTKMILREFDRDERFIEYVADRPAHDFRYSIQAKKLAGLGFVVKSNMRERLRQTIQWYREHEEWWRPLKKDAYTVK